MTKKKYHINKRCIKVVDKKNVKESNGKKIISKIYQRTKVQKVGSSKNEGVRKT